MSEDQKKKFLILSIMMYLGILFQTKTEEEVLQFYPKKLFSLQMEE
jgi:hypothetical protein